MIPPLPGKKTRVFELELMITELKRERIKELEKELENTRQELLMVESMHLDGIFRRIEPRESVKKLQSRVRELERLIEDLRKTF